MQQLANRQLVRLLVQAYNSSIKDFYYFPDVIYVEDQRMEREDFLLLLSEGYIERYKYDSFGRFYRLSKKAEDFLYQIFVLRSSKRRKHSLMPSNQATLYFAEAG